MPKLSYKIPDSLDKGYLDREIVISKDGDFSLKPMPVKYVLVYMLALLLWFVIVFNSFIASGGFVLIVLFTIVYVVIVLTLMRRDKTGIPQASLFISMLDYYPRRLREIFVRSSNRANEFYAFAGIKDINPLRGLISFLDGTYAFAYRVVGAGSILLFEEDKNAILSRCEAFYSKITTDHELIYMTVKEPQKVEKQVEAADLRLHHLEVDDRDLIAVGEMVRDTLRDTVGGNYHSIHQYMLAKASNRETLDQLKNILLSEKNSQLMFKRCDPIVDDDIYNIFRNVYRVEETV